MPKRPLQPTKATESVGTWEVNDIIDHRVNGVLLRTEFLVNWKGFEAKKYNTWEPLDSVYTCPILLKDLVKKKRAQLIRKMKRNGNKEASLQEISSFDPIEETILGKFKDRAEFIPKGNEKILDILKEFFSDDGNFLWLVRFTNDRKPCFVRKCIVAYYWPFHAAMFMHLLVSRAQKIEKFQQKQRRLRK